MCRNEARIICSIKLFSAKTLNKLYVRLWKNEFPHNFSHLQLSCELPKFYETKEATNGNKTSGLFTRGNNIWNENLCLTNTQLQVLLLSCKTYRFLCCAITNNIIHKCNAMPFSTKHFKLNFCTIQQLNY